MDMAAFVEVVLGMAILAYAHSGKDFACRARDPAALVGRILQQTRSLYERPGSRQPIWLAVVI